MAHQIFIVEDNELVRQGYVMLLELEPDLEVCGEAEDAAQALEEVPESGADVVVVDVTLPGMDGLELVGRLLDRRPELPILVISGRDEHVYAERARDAGAMGYMDKKTADSALVDAIRTVLDGDRYQPGV